LTVLLDEANQDECGGGERRRVAFVRMLQNALAKIALPQPDGSEAPSHSSVNLSVSSSVTITFCGQSVVTRFSRPFN